MIETTDIYGIKVFVDPFLPVEQTATVFDIETREEHSVLTGGWIDAIQAGGDMYVSKKMFELLKKEIDE